MAMHANSIHPTQEPAAARGLMLTRLNRHSEALGSYDRAIQLDPANTLAYAGKNLLLTELNRYAES